jgi:hypothetical protein
VRLEKARNSGGFMMKLASSLGFVVILHLTAIAQVDTLRLQEISNFTTTDRIYQTYFQDVNNDSLLEMIICQANRIDIYNPLNGNLLWTSPALGRNSAYWKVEFGDLNNDGYTDLAVSDSELIDPSYVKVFDVIHDSLLWTSPNLNALQKCIAIGDRNSDGSNDIIIFTRGAIHYQNTDTAWVDIYDGPDFQLSAHEDFSILSQTYMDPHFYPGVEARRSENLNKAIVADISSNGVLQRKMVLFLDVKAIGGTYDGVYSFNYNLSEGNYKIFDPSDLSHINVDGDGGMLSCSLEQNDDGIITLCVHTAYRRRLYVFDPYGSYSQTYYCNSDYAEFLSANGSYNSTRLINYETNLPGTEYYSDDFIIGDIDLANEGEELLFSVRDSIKIFSYPTAIHLWSSNLYHADLANYYLLHSNSILGTPQILCAYWNPPSKTFNGTTGEFLAIFPYDTLWTSIVADINNDGDDEIVKIATINNIRIYSVVNGADGINDDTGQIPSQFKLYPAYPNPFNPSTTISYDLLKESPVNIGIYDILGQRITTLINQKQPAGHHQIIWNAKDFSSGIYFYKIQAGDNSETEKMLLLK